MPFIPKNSKKILDHDFVSEYLKKKNVKKFCIVFTALETFYDIFSLHKTYTPKTILPHPLNLHTKHDFVDSVVSNEPINRNTH